uniref:Deltamethrin resistance protein prag01 domain-containing protein n=2 Tax=Meloidogyne floridensis TaxID=298350 RepID=A0A915NPB1_9BILA
MCFGQIRFGVIPAAKRGYLQITSQYKPSIFTPGLNNCSIEFRKYQSTSTSSQDNKYNWTPTEKDRRNLVRYGFFKSINDIPEELPPSFYKRYHNRTRFIMVGIFSLVFTIIVFGGHFVTSSYLNKVEQKRESFIAYKKSEREAASQK